MLAEVLKFEMRDADVQEPEMASDITERFCCQRLKTATTDGNRIPVFKLCFKISLNLAYIYYYLMSCYTFIGNASHFQKRDVYFVTRVCGLMINFL